MNSKRFRFRMSIGTLCVALLLMTGAARAARANLAISGGTPAQRELVESLYLRTIPVQFRRAQQIRVQFLADGPMDASIRENDSHENDDDRSTIDGIYEDEPPVILLRSSRPSSELAQVFAHEYGHFVWSSRLSANQRDVFQRIYSVSRDDHHLVTDYAAMSPEEGFAETFSFFALRPRTLAALDPRAYQFLAAIVHSAVSSPGSRREWEIVDPSR